MPTIIVIGGLDTTCPLAHQEILFKALSSEKKELHIIKGLAHAIRAEKHLTEIYQTINNWLKSLE